MNSHYAYSSVIEAYEDKALNAPGHDVPSSNPIRDRIQLLGIQTVPSCRNMIIEIRLLKVILYLKQI